ncbi:hypothetical protein JCM6882_006156 [Rhodosporidiobolus microsporus]
MAPPVPGQLHLCSSDPTLTAFEFASPSSSPSSPNLVLFIGGLSDSFLSVPYLQRLNATLASHGWGLAQAQLRSAGHGWGGANVKEDAEQLGAIVRYFREEQGKEKVVLFGHSTGCQDAIAYAHLLSTGSSLPPLDGIVLQAPVSDREPTEHYWPHIIPREPRSSYDLDEFVPSAWSKTYFCISGVTNRRWLSLMTPPPSDTIDLLESEDFFSSDLSDTRLSNAFGAVSCPLLVLLGGNDAYPPHVKEKLPQLLQRFEEATGKKHWSPLSKIIEGASHNISEKPQAQQMADTVVQFVQGV